MRVFKLGNPHMNVCIMFVVRPWRGARHPCPPAPPTLSHRRSRPSAPPPAPARMTDAFLLLATLCCGAGAHANAPRLCLEHEQKESRPLCWIAPIPVNTVPLFQWNSFHRHGLCEWQMELRSLLCPNSKTDITTQLSRNLRTEYSGMDYVNNWNFTCFWPFISLAGISKRIMFPVCVCC